MTAPRQVPPLPSRAYVSVTLDVDESGREMLRTVSLDGRRWQVTREGPPRTVGRATEALVRRKEEAEQSKERAAVWIVKLPKAFLQMI